MEALSGEGGILPGAWEDQRPREEEELTQQAELAKLWPKQSQCLYFSLDLKQ